VHAAKWTKRDAVSTDDVHLHGTVEFMNSVDNITAALAKLP